jgi:hypothetical protein
VFNRNQQLVLNSIPLPYVYCQFKGEKALLKWNKFQMDALSQEELEERKFKPKDPGKIIWKISNIWIVKILL